MDSSSDEHALRSLFSSAELAEIDSRSIKRESDGSKDALSLLINWRSHIEKIDRDRALSWDDRSVWNQYDLVAALTIRDHLQCALEVLPADVRSKIENWVLKVDEKFSDFTVSDSGERIQRVVGQSINGRQWWWFRIPADGPIATDFERMAKQGWS
ncbi:hypothetical protein [Nocardia camponoti]|uniref:Uncharacterized protein n=1 Tax=Nocardia camponoti TaxID=1616106 RepID=A0A917QGV2_9NOCA|nr:hypothetical protein [Nocardia camponoti]GGK49967.1 hypothetical protein GCM10011591_21850 [Nocardia camponoti]